MLLHIEGRGIYRKNLILLYSALDEYTLKVLSQVFAQ